MHTIKVEGVNPYWLLRTTRVQQGYPCWTGTRILIKKVLISFLYRCRDLRPLARKEEIRPTVVTTRFHHRLLIVPEDKRMQGHVGGGRK
jgi:hypothetical protein